jgi:hypothetical protein
MRAAILAPNTPVFTTNRISAMTSAHQAQPKTAWSLPARSFTGQTPTPLNRSTLFLDTLTPQL